jgi:hypothetical protein
VFPLEDDDLLIADEVVIELRGGLDVAERDALLASYGLELLDEYPPGSGRLLARAAGPSLDAANSLHADERVHFATPNFYSSSVSLSQACSFPEPGWGGATDCSGGTPPPGFDPLTGSQWQWDVSCVWQAWEIPGQSARGSPEVLVAVSDFEIDPEHEDLAANFVEGKNFYNPGHLPNKSHGTAVAGILVADDNGTGIMGVAPDCRFLYVQSPAHTNHSFYDISNFYWAANKKARVFNVSWKMFLDNEDLVTALRRVAEEGAADNKGMVITVAAGNSHFQIPAYRIASHPLVLAVSGTFLDYQPDGSFSERRECNLCTGKALDLVVPHRKRLPTGEILTWTTLGAASDSYYCLTDPDNAGTSWCAPFAGGIAALMISRDPSLHRDEIFQILFHTTETDFSLESCPNGATVDPIDPVTGHSKDFGYGRVHAQRAVQAVVDGARWPEPAADFVVEPERRVLGTLLRWRLRWTHPRRSFNHVVVFKSTIAGQRLAFRPPDGTHDYVLGETVSDGAGGSGKVVYVGSGTSFFDEETAPGGLRHYTIFAVHGGQGELKRYSFGREARLRTGSLYQVTGSVSLASVLSDNAVQGGDLIWVKDGTYLLNNAIVWTSDDEGSDEAGPVFLAGESPPVSAGGAYFTPSGSFSGTSALQIYARQVSVKHLGFRGFASSAAIEVMPTADQVQLISNRIERCAVGIRLGEAGGAGHEGPVLVQNNILTNLSPGAIAGAIGIYCPTKPVLGGGGFGGFYTIANNTLVLEEGTGVQFDFVPTVCSIQCGSSDGDPQGNSLELFNNIIQCDAGGNDCATAADACIRINILGTFARIGSNNNLLLGPVIGAVGTETYCSLGAWRGAVYADKESISLDPLFDGPDYRLAEHSECVNRGQGHLLSGALYPSDYFAGNFPERVRAGRLDIGADEVDNPDLGKEFIRGDANEDGAVNLTDYIFLRDYLFFGGPAPICPDAADANDDERLDVSDMVHLSNWLFNAPEGHPYWLRPPYPECGVDPFGLGIGSLDKLSGSKDLRLRPPELRGHREAH